MNVESSKFAPDFFGAAATELESVGIPMNDHPRSVVALRPIIPGIAPGLELIGFKSRCVATLIDGAIVVSLTTALIFMLELLLKEQVLSITPEALVAIRSGILIVAPWLYFAGLEAAPTQGTIGKLFVNARVARLDGQPIGFTRATFRYFFKALSVILLPVMPLSALVAYKFERKQTIHDMFAGTIVPFRPAIDYVQTIVRPNAALGTNRL
jgi:uncharacterized RDD family membrane protein YckC